MHRSVNDRTMVRMFGQAEILRWGLNNLRDLPWRRTRDPWAIAVAEFMLQQTQVDRVVPKYHAFLAAYPTLSDCASAPLRDVLILWQGLGYPRRAKSLHDLSQTCVAQFDGLFPTNREDLLKLPGVGPYTARAIGAFALEQSDAAVVDTNIGRVLARQMGHSLQPREAQSLADSLVPGDQPWLWNQSIMELGAVICRSRVPQCAACPVASTCQWLQYGGPDPAIGSAGVSSKQSKFAGSDRQGRGKFLRAVVLAPVAPMGVAAAAGWPDDVDRSARVVATLLADGLIATDEIGRYVLPS